MNGLLIHLYYKTPPPPSPTNELVSLSPPYIDIDDVLSPKIFDEYNFTEPPAPPPIL